MKHTKEMESSPHLKLTIDMRADDKDIYYELFQQIKAWREAKKVKRFNIRDPIKIFPLYCQAWDLRKGSGRLTFRQIARKMGANIQVTKARFYKAFELIYGQAYDKELFTKAKNTVHKESLRKHCGTCNERENCKDPCPDVIPFVNQDWRERDYREVQSNIRN